MLDTTHNNHSAGDIDMQEEPPEQLDSDDGEDMDLGDLDLNSIVAPANNMTQTPFWKSKFSSSKMCWSEIASSTIQRKKV
jgi:hypothetical protein